MADIKIIVDTTSLVDAKKKLTAFQDQMGKTQSILGLTRALGSVESNVQELIRAQDKGSLSQRSFQQGLLEQRKALEAMGLSSYMARKRVEELAQAIRNQEATRRAAQAAEEAARATQRLADRQRELRMRFQEGYAQFTRQREAMRSLREAYRSGLITLQQYETQLARIRAANQGNVAGTNNLGVAMQQTGYQVGDFVVQIQSGTNPMVAFGQQATQLVGVMYLLPPATLAARVGFMGLTVSVSALAMSLGIIIPIATAIGAYFMRMSGTSKNLSQRLDDLEATTQKVTAAFEMLADTELNEKFGDTTDDIRSMAAAMLELNSAAQLQNLVSSLESIEKAGQAGTFTKFFKGMAAGLTFGLLGAGEQKANEEAFAKLGFDMSLATFEGYIENLKKLASSGDRGGVVQAFNAFLKDASDNGAELTVQGVALAKEMFRVALATAEINALLNGSAAAAKKLKESMEAGNRESDIIAQLYADVAAALERVKEKQEEIAQARDKELKSLQDQLALNTAILKFGKDSTQVAKIKADQDREAYLQQLKTNGIYGDSLNILMAAYDANVKVTNEISTSEEKARAFADALKEAVSAMSSLATFSSNLDKALAVSVAKVQALKSGTDASVAGLIAGQRADLQAKIDAAAASGVDRSIIERMYGGARQTISQLEASEAERVRLQELRRGSGGGGADQRESRLEQLMSELMTEQEKVQEWRNTQLELLQEFNDQELALIGGQAEAKARIEQEYADRMAQIRDQERSTRLTETSNMFSALANVAATGGKKMIKVQATLSAVGATIAAYETAIKAAAEAKTIPGRIAAYASFLATGLGAVAQIKAAGGIGGGATASGAAAAVPAAASVEPQRVIVEGLDRNSLYTGEQLSNIFEALYKENKDRGFVFEVAR